MVEVRNPQPRDDSERLVHLLVNRDCSLDDLMSVVPGPGEPDALWTLEMARSWVDAHIARCEEREPNE
jgi:hypothetical protein